MKLVKDGKIKLSSEEDSKIKQSVEEGIDEDNRQHLKLNEKAADVNASGNLIEMME